MLGKRGDWENSCRPAASKLTPTPFWANTILFICSLGWLYLGSHFLQDANCTSCGQMTYLVHFNFFFPIIFWFCIFVYFNLRPSFLNCVLRYVNNLRDKLEAAPGLHSRNSFHCSITRENNYLQCVVYWATSILSIRGGFSAIVSSWNPSLFSVSWETTFELGRPMTWSPTERLEIGLNRKRWCREVRRVLFGIRA